MLGRLVAAILDIEGVNHGTMAICGAAAMLAGSGRIGTGSRCDATRRARPPAGPLTGRASAAPASQCSSCRW